MLRINGVSDLINFKKTFVLIPHHSQFFTCSSTQYMYILSWIFFNKIILHYISHKLFCLVHFYLHNTFDHLNEVKGFTVNIAANHVDDLHVNMSEVLTAH